MFCLGHKLRQHILRGRLVRLVVGWLDRFGRYLPSRNSTVEHLRVGVMGEEEAYFRLRQLGYVMVERNFRSPRLPWRDRFDRLGWERVEFH